MQKEEYLFKWKYEQTFTYWLIHSPFKLTWVNSGPAHVFLALCVLYRCTPSLSCEFSRMLYLNRYSIWSLCYVVLQDLWASSSQEQNVAPVCPVGTPAFMNPTKRPPHSCGFAQRFKLQLLPNILTEEFWAAFTWAQRKEPEGHFSTTF